MTSHLAPPNQEELVISASGAHVRKGQVKNDRAPEIKFEEIEIMEKIGGGCFGSVYKGKCRGQIVAVKQLHKQNLDSKTLEDFRKEVDIMTQMRHPNVVLFMGACTEPGKLTIVCELMQDNVNDILRKNKDIPLSKRVRIAKGAAKGMAWLHGADPQIIHRDLKPANLLVDKDWNVKVCDFGLSQVKQRETKIKDGKSIPGTPLWMAPEVLLGKEVDDKADVYSFGIVLWEIITGKDLFPHMDSYSTFKKAITKDDERPEIPADTHPSLKELMEICWHKDSSKRPPFTEIVRILDKVLIDCLISDPVANKFWKENFLEYEEILWKDFKEAFRNLLGLPPSNAKDKDKELGWTCLQKIVAQPNTAPNPKDPFVVTLDKFAHVVGSFGPIKLGTSFDIIDQIKLCMRQDWFHGDITKDQSEQLLLSQTKGSFLVRTSNTKPSEPFTISKYSKNGKINHQRIKKRKDGSLEIKGEKQTFKSAGIEKGDNLTHLIKNAAKELYLKTPCPGSPYKSLFVSDFKEIAHGYLPGGESDSD